MSAVWIIDAGVRLSLTKSAIAVSTHAGHSAVDLIPSEFSSRFIACVRPTSANFVAE